MLYFTRWKALGIILTALIVCLCAVPNFFPEAQVKTWPAWAQRRLLVCRRQDARSPVAAALVVQFKAQWALLDASFTGERPGL